MSLLLMSTVNFETIVSALTTAWYIVTSSDCTAFVNLTTPPEVLKKLSVALLVKKFHVFYGTL